MNRKPYPDIDIEFLGCLEALNEVSNYIFKTARHDGSTLQERQRVLLEAVNGYLKEELKTHAPGTNGAGNTVKLWP